MNNNVPMGTDECGYAPWNEKDGKTRTVTRKLYVTLVKEVEVKTDDYNETPNDELLDDYYQDHRTLPSMLNTLKRLRPTIADADGWEIEEEYLADD